eukprot:TRINITY_DN5488_c2_g1_i1.p1 TRINITY_DN5488_c2_g1~~TRINITY_DN5488_c2_g1_i1.p1  ORF type:complete len:453 (-),score=121.04 TRINITY_DN5488_c2_g1_i1:6-1337(-)
MIRPITALFVACMCVSFLAATSVSASTTRSTTLVLLEDLGLKQSHSSFFSSLQSRGHTLVYADATDPSLSLTKYGEYVYDNVIVFAPTVEDFGGSVDVDALLDFIDDGRNILIATGTKVSDSVRDLARECGVEFDDDHTAVYDHFNFDSSDFDGDHTLIVADRFANAPVILANPSPILFRGIGHTLATENTKLVLPLLSGASTAYSAAHNADLDTASMIAGSRTTLVSVMQARNNARVGVVGSLDVFSNAFLAASVRRYSSSKAPVTSGNAAFTTELTKWVFQEKGRLRISDVTHSISGELTAPEMYRVNEFMDVSLTVEEFDGKKWIPYNANYVQLEFVMLDPHWRVTLPHNGHGLYSTTVQVPDVYGIFAFRVHYWRLGYSYLDVYETGITVRPLRHNEYERFIVSAYPYYASALSMMFGLFLFSWVFLYHRDVLRLLVVV